MASTDIAVPEQSNSGLAPSKPDRSKRIDQLTPRVRRAVELMVWHGLPFEKAAIEVGLTSRAMRLALCKPHVLAYLRQQGQVLRGSEGPKSIHRLREIRDAANNKPAVDAALYFLSNDDQQ